MILGKIRSHNHLSGFLFSIVEFLIMALVTGPFGLYYIIHTRYLYAFVFFGTIINYTYYFMEHLEELLLGGTNPHQNAALFGLLFDEIPM